MCAGCQETTVWRGRLWTKAFGLFVPCSNIKPSSTALASSLRTGSLPRPKRARCDCVKQTLSLATRTFVCDDCGASVDRDENASVNLEVFAASSAVSAWGEARSGAVPKNRGKPAPKKQERTALAHVTSPILPSPHFPLV